MARNSSSIEEVTAYWIEAFKGYFSRSLNGCGYNLLHPEFESYVAMMLHQQHTKNRIGNDSIYNKLVSMYGTLPGIDNGTSYWRPSDKNIESNQNIIFNDKENKIMQYYELLNDIGKHEATKRVEEMTYAPQYMKEKSLTQAARNDYEQEPGELEAMQDDIINLPKQSPD